MLYSVSLPYVRAYVYNDCADQVGFWVIWEIRARVKNMATSAPN